MNTKKAVVTFVFITTSLLFSSCNSSSEFQNDTYYMDSNHDIYFTVTDLKDEVDPEGKYYKTCKIRLISLNLIMSIREDLLFYFFTNRVIIKSR